MKGYIQVYTGDGKGKTTAAIGLAIRSIGAGHRVCIIQFMKSLAYSEQKILKSLPGITLITLGKPYFIAKEGMLTEEEIKAWGDKVTDEDTKRILSARKPNVELVFTGRNVPNLILDSADLITEMKKIRHYYDKGVIGREGIED